MDANFMLQDTFGISIAGLLFALIFIFPGHLTGWLLDIFSFRERTPIVQIIMGMTFSLMITPAVLFLIYRFSSSKIIIVSLWVIAIISGYILFGSYKRLKSNGYREDKEVRNKKIAILLGIFWVMFAIFTFVNLQIDHRLYFSNNSYDLTTRVSVVDAITRTGVPPVNPTYYPGRPVEIDLLYYYWYILGSIIDQIGGKLVLPHHAMIASIIWAGGLLFATVATYMRIRNGITSAQIWKKSLIATQLFAISGLDVIVVSILFILFKVSQGYLPFQGGIEAWNMPIMSWLNAVAWVPHHLGAALACMISIPMLIQLTKTTSIAEKLKYTMMIGFGFASAFGLSVWVMVLFSIFWIVWAIYLAITQKKYQMVFWMCTSALFGILVLAPFLRGLLQSQSSSPDSFLAAASPSPNSVLPVALYVRPFILSDFFDANDVTKSLMNLFLLPINYIFELGFFFVVAILWYKERYKPYGKDNQIYVAELILVAVSTIMLSFSYSTLTAVNDFGIRGWLPTQFVLVVWASDLLLPVLQAQLWITPKSFSPFKKSGSFGRVMGTFLIVGLLTTTLEFVSLRTWSILVDLNVTGPNNGVSPDTYLGERTYDARRAYEYLRQNVAQDAIIQSNPTIILDRPAGLYGSKQMVIADRTAYGVSADSFNQLSADIGSVFTQEESDWQFIDTKCRQYSIDYLIINDVDPLWRNMQTLSRTRTPFYQNDHYIIFSCGDSDS